MSDLLQSKGETPSPRLRKTLLAVIAACALAFVFAGPADASGPAARPAAAGSTELQPGQELTGGQDLVDMTMSLVLGTDGNLVLDDAGHAVWANGITNQPNSHLIMQTDGNLVEYNPAGSPVWVTGTYGHPGAYLGLGSAGEFGVYDFPTTLWQSPYPNTYLASNQSDVLFAGQTEGAPGQEMLDAALGYSLYEYDGWLEMYKNGTNNLLWSEGSYYPSGAYAIMQSDGNFVLYHGGTAVWSTNTGGHPASYGYYLHLQADGNLVVYSDFGQAEWSSHT